MENMVDLISKFKTSGLTQEAFCKENDITLEKLRYHLYRKNKTNTVTKCIVRKQKAAPAFLSFHNQEHTAPKLYQDAPSSLTIIHGKFTAHQLATLISQLDSTC
jgi:hypothetical protein